MCVFVRVYVCAECARTAKVIRTKTKQTKMYENEAKPNSKSSSERSVAREEAAAAYREVESECGIKKGTTRKKETQTRSKKPNKKILNKKNCAKKG